MVVQLSSLRVASDLDPSGYARGAKQIDAANASMAASSRSVGATVVDMTGRISRSGDALSQLERRYVDGARQAQAFEAGLRRLGGVVEKDERQLQRAVAVLSGMQNQFGMTANAAELAGRGWAGAARIAEQLASSTEALGRSQAALSARADELRRQFDGNHDAARRMDSALAELAEAERLGVQITGGYAAALDNLILKYDATAQAARRVADERAEMIRRGRAEQDVQTGQQRWNDYANVRQFPSGSARDSAAIFEASAREADDMARAVTVLRAQIDPLGAAQAKLNSELLEFEAFAARGAISSAEMAKASDLARQRFDATAAALRRLGSAGEMAGKSQGAQQFNTSNLAAQGFDIASTAAFMPWYTVALQQGPQVAQVFNDIKASGASIGPAVAGAFGQMLNPISLATMGVIGLSAAAIQWLSSAKSDAKTLDEVLQNHGQTVQHLTALYGEAAKAIEGAASSGGKAFSRAMVGIDESDLKKQLETQMTELRKSVRGEGGILGSVRSFLGTDGNGGKDAVDQLSKLSGGLKAYQGAADRFLASIRTGGVDMVKYEKDIDAVSAAQMAAGTDPDAILRFNNAMMALGETAVSVNSEFSAFSVPINKMMVDLSDGQFKMTDFIKDIEEIGKAKGMEEQANKVIGLLQNVVGVTDAMNQLKNAALAAQRSYEGRGIQGLDYEDMGRERRRIAELQTAEQERLAARLMGIRAVTDAEKIAAAAAEAGAGITNSTERRIREEAAAMGERARIDAEARQAARDRDMQRRAGIESQTQEIDLLGRSVGEVARLQYQFEQLSTVKREAATAGRVVSPEEIRDIEEAAAAVGKLTEELAVANAKRDLLFERQQITRSPLDQRIATEMRRIYGDNYETHLQDKDGVADEIRKNEKARIEELMRVEKERSDARLKGIRAVTDAEKIAAAVAAAGAGITDASERKIREENAARETRAQLDAEAAQSARDRDLQRRSDLAGQQLELSLIDKSVGEVARLRYEFEHLDAVKQEAARTGRAVSPEEIAAISETASAVGRLTEQMTLANAQRDLLFEREQMGRSREEQQVYAEIRRLGLDINSAAGQQVATTIRMNAAIEKQRDMWEDIASTVASIFTQPLKDVDDLFNRVFSGFAKLGQQNIENLFQGLFAGAGVPGRASSSGSATSTNLLGQIGDFLGGIFTDRKVIGAQNRAINTASQQISVKPLVSAMGQVGTAVAQTTGQMQSSITAYANAIKTVESGGNYLAQGPVVAKGMYAGQRAQGAYQVMPGNIPSWTKELLGYSVSTQEFLRSRSIQDGVFQQQFMKSFNKYGNFMDAASVWFTGKPLSKATGANDGYTKVEEYVRRANAALANPSDITSAVASGTKQGISAIATAGANVGAGMGAAGSVNAPGGAGKSNAAGSPGMSGFANAALGGLGLGFQSESAGMGALGGALSGFMAAGPIGAVVGGIAGLVGGLFGASRKRKQEQKQARQQLNQNSTLISQLFAIGEGRGTGSATQAYNEFYDKTAEIDEVAQKANDSELVEKLRNNVNKFFVILEKDFVGKLPGIMDAYSSGYGSNSPFMQGAAAMENLRTELKNFVADAKDFGELQLKHNRDLTPEQLAQRVADAERAAQQMVLSTISGVRELGAVETQMLSLKGAAATAVTTLEQLGMETEAAARAVDSSLSVAFAKLKDKYIGDLTASINEMSGFGYVNSILDAQITYQQRIADAAQLGMDGSLAMRELSLSIGEIVRQAGLGSTELQMLAGAFPQLQFILNGVSTSTMTVAEATSQLQAAYEKEASVLTETISTAKQGIAAIDAFRKAMKLGSSSPLSPFDKVTEAMKQLRDTADKAAAGDPEAIGKITQVGQDALDEARAYYASSTDYFEIWKEVESIMARVQGATEGQLSKAEQQKAALDASVSGILKINDSVVSVRDAIDQFNQAQKTNTDMLAAQLALIGKAGANSIDAAYRANLDRTADAGGLAFYQNQIASGKTVDEVVDAIANSREAQINALYKQIFNRPLDAESRDHWLNSGKSIEQIAADLQYAKTQGAYARGGIVGAFAAGGRVGNGLYNADSVRARYAGGGDIMLAGGEAVVRATSVTSQTWPMIDHINRTGNLPDGHGNALLIEVRTLRATVEMQAAQLAQLTAALAASANRQSKLAEKTVSILTDVSSELKLVASR